MTVKHAFLAVLTLGPAYGLQLRDEVALRAPHRRRVNVGQVYGTLDRLVKAGLVKAAGETEDGLALYRVTDAGRSEASAWLASPYDESILDWTEMLDQILIASSLPAHPWWRLLDSYRTALDEKLRTDESSGDPIQVAYAHAERENLRAALVWIDQTREHFGRADPGRELSPHRPRRGRKPLENAVGRAGLEPATDGL